MDESITSAAKVQKLLKELEGYADSHGDLSQITFDFGEIRGTVDYIRTLEKEHRAMREALKFQSEYPKGSKCGECGYRRLQHKADKAREVLSSLMIN